MPKLSDKKLALGERIDELFKCAENHGFSYTNDYVADRLKEINPLLRVSGCYISALRNGNKTNPSIDLLVALSEFFGVGPDFFLAGETIVTPPKVEKVLEDPTVRAIALRANGVKKSHLTNILALLDDLRQLQGLPPILDQVK